MAKRYKPLGNEPDRIFARWEDTRRQPGEHGARQEQIEQGKLRPRGEAQVKVQGQGLRSRSTKEG